MLRARTPTAWRGVEQPGDESVRGILRHPRPVADEAAAGVHLRAFRRQDHAVDAGKGGDDLFFSAAAAARIEVPVRVQGARVTDLGDRKQSGAASKKARVIPPRPMPSLSSARVVLAARQPAHLGVCRRRRMSRRQAYTRRFSHRMHGGGGRA